MQSWITETLLSGRYAAPDELVSEQLALADRVRRLDGDNFQSVTAAKVAVGAWEDRFSSNQTTSQNTTLTDTNAANDVIPIPDNDGTPWLIDFSTGDGQVEGTLNATFDCNTGGGADAFAVIWIGVKLDGTLIAISPSAGGLSLTEDTCEVDFVWPVQAGPHRLELVCGLNGAEVAAGTTVVVTWGPRSVLGFGVAA